MYNDRITKEQIQLLQKIKNVGCYEYIPLESPEIPALHFLSQRKLIRHIISDNKKPAYCITEEGNAELSSYFRNKLYKIITVIISALSLVCLIISNFKK